VSKSFFVQIQLLGVEEDHDGHVVLADEMASRGFVRTIALPTRVARLPLGSFLGAADKAGGTTEEALRRAELSAKATGLGASIVVIETDAPIQTYGLTTTVPAR
jgi:hypothetical protein